MSGGRSFRSVFMVASCAGAALGCYLVSLRVASERAALEDVETKIVLAQRDLRLLQTEIGTRGRLAQLERWNVKVLALSAPSADQFLNGGFELAKMTTPQHKIELDAPVVLASAPANAPRPQVEGVQTPPEDAGPDLSPKQIMHVASLTRETPREDKAIVSLKPSKPEPKAGADRPTEAKPQAAKSSPAKVTATASAKPKPVSAPAKKPAATATAAKSDPLAPLAAAPAKPKKVASATSKDSAKKQ